MDRQPVARLCLFVGLAGSVLMFFGGTLRSQPAPIRQSVEPPIAPAGTMPPEVSPKRLPPQRLPILDPEADVRDEDQRPEARPAGGIIPNPAVVPAQFVTPAPTQTPVPWQQPPAPEGPPPPVVTLLIRGPASSAIGQDVGYRIFVQNRATVAAHDVVVKVPVRPQIKLLKAAPEAKESEQFWTWNFGKLEGGATKEISLSVRPGDGTTTVDLVARVAFEYGQWVQSRLVPTTLSVKKTGPETAVRDEPIIYKIDVFNPSKVSVKNVKLTDAIPADMEYAADAKARTEKSPAGPKREWDLGTVRAGEHRIIEVKVTPRKEGKFLTASQVSGNGAADDARFTTRVEEARLSVQLTPPEKSTAVVGRPCKYIVKVTNDGSVKLSDVKVRLTHPADVKVARAPAGGRYGNDSSATWVIRELAPGTFQTLNIDLKTQTEGRKHVKVEASADRGLTQTAEHEALFEGVANVDWGRIEAKPTVQRGDSYEVSAEVTNKGTSRATGFRLSAELPAGVTFESSPDGKHADGKIFFAPDGAQLPAGKTAKFVFRVRAERAGQATISLVMQADQLPAGTVKHDILTTIVPAAAPPPVKEKDAPKIPVSPIKIG